MRLTHTSPNTRVLLTGATGFIGRACLARLRLAGFEVHAVSSKPTTDTTPGVVWHQADLTDSDARRRLLRAAEASHLLHLVWPSVSGDVWNSPENDVWAEIGADLVREFHEHGGTRVVGCGSCSEYDWQGGVCEEGVTPLEPSTRYGRCKARLWRSIEGYAESTDTLSAAWGRVFFAYGPGDHDRRLVASTIRSLLRGEQARCSHGRQVRDYIYVDDIADALAALVASEAAGAYNIATGEGVELRTIVETIGEVIGRPELVLLGAIPASPHEPPRIVGSARKLAEAVGWTRSIDLRTGIERTVDWWSQRLATPARHPA